MEDEIEKVKWQKFKEFKERVKGRACLNHMHYSRKEGVWSLNYDPCKCAAECRDTWCSLRNVALSGKRGNVYYDMETSWYRMDDTIFYGDRVVNVLKQERFLKHPVSMTICEEVAKRCTETIEKELRLRFSGYYFSNPTFHVRVLRVYAAEHASRDLLQDLEDIRNGIRVVHADDVDKRNKKHKEEHIKKRGEKNRRRLENLILKYGIDGLPQKTSDYRHAVQWLGWDRIHELEAKRRAATEAILTEFSLEDLL